MVEEDAYYEKYGDNNWVDRMKSAGAIFENFLPIDEEASKTADEMLAESWKVLDAPTPIFNTTDEELDYLYKQQKARDTISMEQARRERDWVRE